MDNYICIHGHFYQPPRENPWLEEVELQDSAYPFHDWNERITAECYAPNYASRILSPDNAIVDIVNNYTKISFNFGPTLLSWMERHQPEVYHAILEADRISSKRYSGHGSAIAQIYNHMIMPLASKRDKITQTHWGIKDFTRRFGRFPEGIWLPETAVDIETLEIIADAGILFTILSPHQVKRVKKISEEKWHDVNEGDIDPAMPYLCLLPSGNSIHVFLYNASLSRDVAFGNLLSNGESFASRLTGAIREERDLPQIVHFATDGETFGHHHPHADMALAFALHAIESGQKARLTNYGEYLENNRATHMVEIVENTSWSCAHGVERWRSNCGCNVGKFPGGKQPWRAPLRQGMDWLRDQAVEIYEKQAPGYLLDPWRTRDEYIDLISNRSKTEVERFLLRRKTKSLNKVETVQIRKLLEMQRYAMLMYTSCGWFFDDISGIETIQILQYACRVIQLAEEVQNRSLEPGFLNYLRNAPSLLEENGEVVYERYVKPARVDFPRVSAHHSMLTLYNAHPEKSRIYCYSVDNKEYELLTSGKLRLAIGYSRIASEVTGEETEAGFAMLDLGDHNLNGGICPFPGLERFSAIRGQVEIALERGDVPALARLLDRYFGTFRYSLSSLFKDEQRKILMEIMKLSFKGISAAYGQMHENHYSLMNYFKNLQMSLPKPLFQATEYIINESILESLRQEETDLVRLESLITESKRWQVALDTAEIGLLVSSRFELLLNRFFSQPEDLASVDYLGKLHRILTPIDIELNLWKSQNIYFSIGKDILPEMDERAIAGDRLANQWLISFQELGRILRVRVSR